jgi:hypothetical protein
MGIAMLFCVKALYEDKLEEQLENVYSHLDMEVFVPPNGDAVHSLVRVFNRGDYDIGTHEVECQMKEFKATGQDLVVDLPNIGFIEGHGLELKAKGHAENDLCIPPYIWANDLSCADIVMKFDYVLTAQPLVQQSKPYRFVYNKAQGWNEQPISSNTTYCPHGLHPMPQ